MVAFYVCYMMEFFEQGVCTALESLPSIRKMKKEQSMIVQGRDVLQNCQKILSGICKALTEAGWKKERDWPTQTPRFVTFVHLPFCNFWPTNPLLLLIYLLGYALYRGLTM